MNRFVGFQDAQGVAVLDTVTGELVYCPFHDAAPRVLRPAVAGAPDEIDTELGPPELFAAVEDDSSEALAVDEAGAATPGRSPFRPERRLEAPRPLVIRYPDASEVAAIKSARLARSRRWPARANGDAGGGSPEEDT